MGDHVQALHGPARPVVALLCALLQAVPAVALGQPVDDARASGPPDAPYLARTPLATLTQTRERPVFVPSRRPPASTPVDPPAPLPPAAARPPDLTLVGIVRSDQHGASAVLLDAASQKTLVLRQGGEVDGWTIMSIDAAHVVLRSGASEVALSFKAKSPAVDD